MFSFIIWVILCGIFGSIDDAGCILLYVVFIDIIFTMPLDITWLQDCWKFSGEDEYNLWQLQLFLPYGKSCVLYSLLCCTLSSSCTCLD